MERDKENGFSVKEVVDMARKVTGKNIKVEIAAARIGAPARLVADAELAKKELNWEPAFASLETIIKHAWLWEVHMVQHPQLHSNT